MLNATLVSPGPSPAAPRPDPTNPFTYSQEFLDLLAELKQIRARQSALFRIDKAATPEEKQLSTRSIELSRRGMVIIAREADHTPGRIPIQAIKMIAALDYGVTPTAVKVVKIEPLPEDHPDRILRDPTGKEPDRIFTHTVEIRYTPEYGALYGVTSDGYAWLWCD